MTDTLIFPSESTCQDGERFSNFTINHLPDELLLEIFDSCRQGISPCEFLWKEKHGWFSMAHVCRKWRAIMFASSSRLDLGISVRLQKLGEIKTVLSDPLPISIKFGTIHTKPTGGDKRRMRAALKQYRARVREIFFNGGSAWFDKYFKKFSNVTGCNFPVLESLSMEFRYRDAPKLINTFLGGPDQSNVHLRRLKLRGVSFASISGLLSSSTSLTDLYLLTDFALSLSSEMLLVACLQGMSCLRCLTLYTPPRPIESPSQPSTPNDIVVLSHLTRFTYSGPSGLLNALVAGLSAPSLQNIMFQFIDAIWPPVVHLPRFINEIEDPYDSVRAFFINGDFRLGLLNQSEPTNYLYPRRFSFESESCLKVFPESVIRISGAVSARFSTVEKLLISFDKTTAEDYVPWRWFFQQFPRVKILRTEGENNHCIARFLLQDYKKPDGNLALLPSLEEIELGKYPPALTIYEIQREPELAAFDPFVSARQQAGRPVKVFLAP